MVKDLITYSSLANNCDKLPLFFRPEWLDIVCQSGKWDPYFNNDNGEFILWPCYKTKKMGLSMISQPPLTPYLGYYSQSKSPNLSKQLKDIEKVNILQISLFPGVRDLNALKTNGYKNSNRFTYILDTKDDQKQLFSNIDAKTRNIINKAYKTLKVVEAKDTTSFNKLNKLTFQHQNKHLPYDDQLVDNLFNHTFINKHLNILVAKKEDIDCAALLLVEDAQTMYCLAIGSDPAQRHTGAVSLALWEAILLAKSKRLLFDFEGSMLPNIEPLFRSFGGQHKSYLRVTKINNKILELCLKAFNKIQID